MTDNNDRSLFEVLEFTRNPQRSEVTKEGIWFNLTDAESYINEIIKNIGSEIKNYDVIRMHEAAVFAAYFGLPADREILKEWGTLTFSEKVAYIKNILCAEKHTSFTKIL